jgi:peptidoglycan/LPS O-acetylase OafA/YrhL
VARYQRQQIVRPDAIAAARWLGRSLRGRGDIRPRPPATAFLDTIMAVGALMAMVLALDRPGAAILLLRPMVQALGCVSCSLYLTHMLVVYAMMAALTGVVTVPTILLLSVPVIALVTIVTYLVVERPTMRLGTWSAVWLCRRSPPATDAAPLAYTPIQPPLRAG